MIQIITDVLNISFKQDGKITTVSWEEHKTTIFKVGISPYKRVSEVVNQSLVLSSDLEILKEHYGLMYPVWLDDYLENLEKTLHENIT